MRYQSKQALLDDIRTEHDLLFARLEEIPKARWHEVGVWGDGWTLSDLVAHLAEWQQMFLGWYEDGLRGTMPQMPAPGYRWSETPKLNRAMWEKHRSRSRAAVRADLDSGYRRIVQLVESLSPEHLLEPGRYEWTGKHALTTYIGPNTASHYRFALKVVKRWLKGTARMKEVDMAENKTKPTGASVEHYIASRANAQQATDCRALMALFKKVTRHSPRMWGPSIVGYGSYRYTSERGRTGEAPLAGFAIRGRELVVYVLVEGEEQRSLLNKLGKHRMGKVCLYFKQLADLDRPTFEKLVVNSVAEVRRRHGWRRVSRLKVSN